MLFRTNYSNPFWRGFFHSVFIFLYSIFITMVLVSLQELFKGEIDMVYKLAVWIFIVLLSFGTTAFLLFYRPMKLVLHHKFKPAAVMMASTLGWLFVFFFVFILGLFLTK